MEEECKAQLAMIMNASGDVIVAVRNLSDPYFGSFLISVYREMDSKIDTLWIKVYKKGKLSSFYCALNR